MSDDIFDDYDNLEEIDLNQMIAENNNNNLKKNIRKKENDEVKNILSQTLTKKHSKNIDEQNKIFEKKNKDDWKSKTSKLKSNNFFNYTNSINLDSDMDKYMTDNAEANLILTNNFICKEVDKVEEENIDIKNNNIKTLKDTLKRTNSKNKNENLNKDLFNLISTININEEIKIKEQNNNSSFFNSTSKGEILISNNISEGLQMNSYVFDGTVKISKLLGEGAQAKVYLGIAEGDEEDNEELVMAIKHFEYGTEDGDTSEIDSIVNKCQTMKELSHDNIIQYFDCESIMHEKEKVCDINIAMEYQETNLSDYIKNYLIENKVDHLPIKLISYITKEILKGLEYLHSQKIIHRDLKPENILMSKDAQCIKIGDFGISTMANTSYSTVKSNIKQSLLFVKRSVAGTAIYMAPEVLLELKYAYDCDIWSLGCIVFECAGGIKPYSTKEQGKKVPESEIQLLKYSSPLEIADENVKDVIYDKKNRVLLDFLQKCWRGNNVYRPTAKELLGHPFPNGQY